MIYICVYVLDRHHFEVTFEMNTSFERTNNLKPVTIMTWILDIGNKRSLEVRHTQGTEYIEFVVLEKSSTGSIKVAGKSTKLTRIQVKHMLDNADGILAIIKDIRDGKDDVEFSNHIGDLFLLRVDQGVKTVDCRKHYIKGGMERAIENLLPGFPGTSFKFVEWDNLCQNKEELYQVAKLSEAICPSCGPANHSDPTILKNCKYFNTHNMFY